MNNFPENASCQRDYNLFGSNQFLIFDFLFDINVRAEILNKVNGKSNSPKFNCVACGEQGGPIIFICDAY